MTTTLLKPIRFGYKQIRHIQVRYSASVARRRAVRRFKCFDAPYKLHVGCGSLRFDGWVNIDQYANKEVTDVEWDLTEPFPIPDSSCQLVYNEHLLEHLAPAQASLFLAECHRVLRPQGVLRIAMPSLEA